MSPRQAARSVATATGSTSRHARTRHARWRAATLVGVHLAFGLHVAHWHVAGRTLAPLELNEVMYTLELGVVTAGFLLMATAALATAFFGRFFCSWACHVLALQDLCAWLLARAGIHPKPVRSRVLILLPPAVMLYMFAWPQVLRLLEGRSLPRLSLWSDEQGWASFLTTNLWRNLPGPGVAAATFLACGFVMVWILGSRSFCRHACPYGAAFALADRVAPGRIIVTDLCTGCGACTAACQSDIRVHEELSTFGNVVSPSCLKDLDCVDACPHQGIRYGFTRPSLMRSLGRKMSPRRWSLDLAEEALLALVLVASILIFRGLYGVVPLFLAIGISVMLAFVAVLTWRLARRDDVHLAPITLKRKGRLTGAGGTLAIGCVPLILFVGHSSFIRWHEHLGARAHDAVMRATKAGASPSATELDAARRHLNACREWGLVEPVLLGQRLHALDVLERSAPAPAPEAPVLARAEAAAAAGRLDEAVVLLAEAVTLAPGSAVARYNRAVILAALGRDAEAVVEYRNAARLDPRDPEIRNNLGATLMRMGEPIPAERELREALALAPGFAHAHFNLGRLLLEQGRIAEAEARFLHAAALDPEYARLLNQQP